MVHEHESKIGDKVVDDKLQRHHRCIENRMHAVWIVARKINPLLTNDSDHEHHSEQKSEHENALAHNQLKLFPIELINECLADDLD